MYKLEKIDFWINMVCLFHVYHTLYFRDLYIIIYVHSSHIFCIWRQSRRYQFPSALSRYLEHLGHTIGSLSELEQISSSPWLSSFIHWLIDRIGPNGEPLASRVSCIFAYQTSYVRFSIKEIYLLKWIGVTTVTLFVMVWMVYPYTIKIILKSN